MSRFLASASGFKIVRYCFTYFEPSEVDVLAGPDTAAKGKF